MSELRHDPPDTDAGRCRPAAGEEGGVSGDIRARLARVRQRVADACDQAGRSPDEIVLVGASKLQPVAKLRAAWEAGLRVFGENRVQEAESKSGRLPAAIDWHLLGPLQSNKAGRAAGLFSTFHAIDRLKIARRLDREAIRRGRTLKGFLEVNLAAEPTKHGFDPEALEDLLPGLAGLHGLEIVGLMAIPPIAPRAEEARRWFARLRRLRDRHDAAFREALHAWRGWLSMGMSHDFAEAVAEGATHIRVGTALFGPRPEH